MNIKKLKKTFSKLYETISSAGWGSLDSAQNLCAKHELLIDKNVSSNDVKLAYDIHNEIAGAMEIIHKLAKLLEIKPDEYIAKQKWDCNITVIGRDGVENIYGNKKEIINLISKDK